MNATGGAPGFLREFQLLSPVRDDYVPQIIRLILEQAHAGRVSDVHLVPGEDALIMQWRVDGVLQTIAGFDKDLASRLIARLKVISGLLTYRTDIPQEGRVAREYSSAEVRVTTFPTLHGEKAAVRLFAANDRLQRLRDLGFPEALLQRLRQHLECTSGVILLTGPSGSGKTTTAYACLRDVIATAGGTRCVMTLEDPIEVAVTGATQSQVRPSAGFDLATGLRSLMRQDPDVILVGEIRDPQTAEAAFQAALTGHLVLTTFHAGSAVEAVTRLLEMQLEPYVVRSGLRTVICQRLLRRSCPECLGSHDRATEMHSGGDRRSAGEPHSGILQESQFVADKFAFRETPDRGCPACGGSGYLGRFVLAEQLDPESPVVAQAVLQRKDSRQLALAAAEAGMQTLREAARAAVAAGWTTDLEVLRVLGRE